MSDRLRQEILDEINDAWLHINVKNNELIRPLELLRTEEPEEFYMRLTWLMSRPEYFCFICRHIFNIEILPLQGLILSELWNKKFPMLIGSRGIGKATSVEEPILTSRGWVRMGEIKHNDKVYGRDGQLHNITGIFPQGIKQSCRLVFQDGRSIECCEDHLWVMKYQKKEIVISTKDLIKNGTMWGSGSKKFTYKYKLPICEPIQYEKKELSIDPYILGCLLGDGCLTTLTPKIASDDQFIIDTFKERLPNFEIKKDKSNNNYTIVDKDRSFNEYEREGTTYRHRNSLVATIKDLKLNVGCKDKFIPEQYKKSSIEDRMEIVRGLLDTDGSISKSGSIEFTNTCEKLVDDLIDILRSLGISCEKSYDKREGELHTFPNGTISARSKYYRVFINTSKPVFKLPRKLSKIKIKSTNREKYTSLISAEYLDKYDEMQCISVDSSDSTYITRDYIVTHNTFLLSLYSMLRAILIPNRKVVVVGAAFRQSKFLYDYMENMWKNAPILRDLCDQGSGPKRDVDMCRMVLGASVVSAIPVGDGQKIRGLRSNDIVADEFASMSRSIFENVIAGFNAVSASPAENVRITAGREKAKELGIDFNSISNVQNFESIANQMILSGTAYYDFNHFAQYWKRWKSIIRSKGDPNKLKEVFGEDAVPESFNHKDYMILRIPVGAAPKGFMDEAQVARSKATVHNGIFLMEFGACSRGDTEIVTDEGVKPIIDIRVGDNVLTHKGRFRQVTKKTFRDYNGPMIGYRTRYCYAVNWFTPDHPFWTGDDNFTELGKLKSTNIAPLTELSGKTEILVSDYTKNYIEINDYIYPKSSKNQLSNETVNFIHSQYKEGVVQSVIARSIGISYERVWSALRQKRPKTAINSRIKLDYNFGLILGYYASEGSSGATGRNIGFALDSHVGIKFEAFIDQLCIAIQECTGVKPKIYSKEDNTCSPTLNSRVFTDMIKIICPGICYTKLIDHDILFSNKDLLRGFIVGMFNGDGHIRHNLATVQLTNLNMIYQIKLALSVFGVNGSVLKPKKIDSVFRGKKSKKTTQQYKISLYGSNFRKFMNIFYDKSFDYDDTNNFELEFISKNIEEYNGRVYNLQVEEDNSYSTLNATVHNCFAKDSQGFFKRSLIESCVGTDLAPVPLPSGPVYFDPILRGSKSRQYVIGVDPASEVDNFSIIILELHPDHRRIVYCWTINRKEHTEKVTKGLTTENNFYSYCARKIRELMGLFPTVRISMDAQGGGISVSEALHDSSQLQPGELPIWPIIEEDKEKETDDKPGLHILEMCQFAKYDWLSEANHGMRKDFEDRVLIFPRFDPITIGLSIEEDKITNRLYDTLEDCVMEIEELKNELSLIEVTTTVNGRDRWDTPEVKLTANRKSRMRKDRYSALLMANSSARVMARTPPPSQYYSYGGFASVMQNKPGKAEYTGPDWFIQGLKGVY